MDPLARWVGVKAVLPRFSGERLDLIVDYLAYVVVPAFALTEATLLPKAHVCPPPSPSCCPACFMSRISTARPRRGISSGFPAIWNIVLLYLFVLEPAPLVSLLIVAFFVAFTFVPLLAVHPFRVERLRPLSCLVTLVWTGTAAIAVANPFPSPLWIQILLLLSAAYFTGVGLYRWLMR
jgi:phosphatidylcholine synthase